MSPLLFLSQQPCSKSSSRGGRPATVQSNTLSLAFAHTHTSDLHSNQAVCVNLHYACFYELFFVLHLILLLSCCCMGRYRTLPVCHALPCERPYFCISARVFEWVHDTSHHSPWLCAPPSPSSVSVRLLSIPAPLRYSSSAAEQCHRSSCRRLSLRSTDCDTATEFAGKQHRKYASRILLTPLHSLLPVGCNEERQRKREIFFFLLRRSSSWRLFSALQAWLFLLLSLFRRRRREEGSCRSLVDDWTPQSCTLSLLPS